MMTQHTFWTEAAHACSLEWATPAAHVTIQPTVVDIAWIDDNDGCGPRKLQNSIRCF